MGLSIGHIAVIIIGCFAVAIISISFIPLRRKKRLERNSNKNNKQNKTEIKVSLDKECVNSRIEFTSYDKDVKQRKLQNLYHASEKRIEMIKKIRAPPIVDGNAGSKNDGEKIDATSNVSQKNINTSGSAVKKIDPEGETVTELTSKPIDKDTTIDATSNVSQKPESVSNPEISDPKTHKKSDEENHPRFFEESKGGARSKEPTMVDSSVGSTFIPNDELAIEEREEKNKKKSQEELRSKEKEDRERKRQMQNDNISDGSYTGFYPSKESSKSDQNLNSDRMYALKMQEEWNNEIKNSSKHTNFDENIEEKFMQKTGNDLKDYLNEHFAMIEDSYRNIDGDRFYSLNCELECDVSSLSILNSDTLNENEQILIEFLLDLEYGNHSTPIKGEHIRNFLKAYKNLLTKPDQPDWESKFKEDFNKLLRFPSLFKVVAKVISVTKQPISIRTGTTVRAQPTSKRRIKHKIPYPPRCKNIYNEFIRKNGDELQAYFEEHLSKIEEAFFYYQEGHDYQFINTPCLSEECHIPSDYSHNEILANIFAVVFDFTDKNTFMNYDGERIRNFLSAYKCLLNKQMKRHHGDIKQSVHYFKKISHFFEILQALLSVVEPDDVFTRDTSSTETPFSITVTSQPTSTEQKFHEIIYSEYEEDIYRELISRRGKDLVDYFNRHVEMIECACQYYKTNHEYKFTGKPPLEGVHELHSPQNDNELHLISFLMNFTFSLENENHDGGEIKKFLKTYQTLFNKAIKEYHGESFEEYIRKLNQYPNLFKILKIILSPCKNIDASVTVPPALDKLDTTVDKQREERKKARENAEKVGKYEPEHDIAKVLTTAIGKGGYSELCSQYWEMIDKVMNVCKPNILYVFDCVELWPLVDLKTCSYDRNECESVKNIINSMNEVDVADHQVKIYGEDIKEIIIGFQSMLNEKKKRKQYLMSGIEELKKIPNYFNVLYLILEWMPIKKRKNKVLRPSNVELSEDTSKFMFPKLTESSVGANESSQKLSECDKESVV